MAYAPKARENLARALRVKRAERRWSQEDLANAIGVSKDTIKNWEAEKTDPGFSQVCKMADLFECSIGAFAMDSPAPSRPSPRERLARIKAEAAAE